ncbi:MAG TPA: hypothetical protein VJZ50_06035, partial [Candidatus Limnocylindrales bacterium]|nr:hypothetical protein [Candidatus Limnocylindrales bacterium]
LVITNDRALRGSGTLANTGTLRKLSHGTTSLALLLDDDGTIALDAGVLDVGGGDGGLGSDGIIEIAERSRLRLRDGATTLGAAASVTGAGEIEVTTNATLTVPASATWEIATTYLTGGALALDGERSLTSLGIYTGTLSGAGTRTVTGSAVLDVGTLAGAGRTVIAPDARLQVGTGVGGTLTINGGHVLALEAGATGVWGPGPHDIALEAPSRIENAGELVITNDRALRGSGTLANTGTLRKLSHGTTSLAIAPEDGSWLVNEGTVEVVAGLLEVTGPGLDNRSIVSLGATPEAVGRISAPAFSQTETATYQVGLAGTTPHARSGSLTVSGPETSLAGALIVSPDSSFAVTAPQQLMLLATPAGVASRSFDTVTGADALPGGATGELLSLPEGVALAVEPGG